jgi:hypothetical protein
MGNICFTRSLPSTHCPIAGTPSPSVSTQSGQIPPTIQCGTCCCSMIPVHSVACDHDNTWDVTPSLLPGHSALAANLPIASASHLAILTRSSRVSHLFKGSCRHLRFSPWLTALTKSASSTVQSKATRTWTYRSLEGDDSGTRAVLIVHNIEFQV